MIVPIKDKDYTTGKLVMVHAIQAMEVQKKLEKGELSEVESIDIMVDILAQSLINGTEKIPYDEIKPEQVSEMKKLITYNLGLDSIEPIYVEMLNEMSGKHKADEGK